MGLASSQARLLTLTARMHQIEYKAAKLEAQKLQMANESTQVYEDYLEALDATKIQYKVLTTDGSTTYQDINSYSDFLAAGYALDYNGIVYNGSTGYRDDKGNVITFTELSEEDAQELLGDDYEDGTTYYSYTSATDSGYVTYDELANVDEEGTEIETVDGGTLYAQMVTNNYAQLCADAFNSDIDNPPSDVSEVITNLINSGYVTIVQSRDDGTFAQEDDEDFTTYETSVSTCTGLQEVSDEVALKKAEAQYEADMKEIDIKDTEFDTELAAIETERDAIKNEMETLETVAKDNIERTFKLFG